MRTNREVGPFITALAAFAALLVLVIGFVYQIIAPELQGCSLFGFDAKATLSALSVLGISGWAVAYYNALPVLIDRIHPNKAGPPSSLAKAEVATDNDLIRLLHDSKTVQIFGSSSDRFRSIIHGESLRLPKQQLIQVLLRDDGSAAREVKLSEQEKKWKDDIGSMGVKVQTARYRFDPLMFRGAIFDKKTAVLGWYYRGKSIRQGAERDWFIIRDEDLVGHICQVFEDLFAKDPNP